MLQTKTAKQIHTYKRCIVLQTPLFVLRFQDIFFNFCKVFNLLKLNPQRLTRTCRFPSSSHIQTFLPPQGLLLLPNYPQAPVFYFSFHFHKVFNASMLYQTYIDSAVVVTVGLFELYACHYALCTLYGRQVTQRAAIAMVYQHGIADTQHRRQGIVQRVSPVAGTDSAASPPPGFDARCRSGRRRCR